jgi:uncharacterized protein
VKAGLGPAAVSRRNAVLFQWETSGQVDTIPAVGKTPPVAMPLDEAFQYYGTPRGAVGGYVNAFAVMSLAETPPYDAQAFAPRIGVPTL